MLFCVFIFLLEVFRNEIKNTVRQRLRRAVRVDIIICGENVSLTIWSQHKRDKLYECNRLIYLSKILSLTSTILLGKKEYQLKSKSYYLTEQYTYSLLNLGTLSLILFGYLGFGGGF